MGILLAFGVGYVVGARAGERGYQDVVDAIKQLRESEEAHDLMSALRSHVGFTLEDVARRLREDGQPINVGDVLARARRLVYGSDPTSPAS